MNSKDEAGYSALHYAARSGNVDICSYLLQNQADVNVTNVGGDTPLHRAAYIGHMELCLLLLQYKADIIAANMDGHSPLHRAAANKQEQVGE